MKMLARGLVHNIRRPAVGKYGASFVGSNRLGIAHKRAWIHATTSLFGRVPFKLADIGEGIAEVEILQFFVKPGDHVSQFDKICEVQSDKATVEITSRYDGVIASVNWQVGQMAPVGSTLVDIDVEGMEAPTQSVIHTEQEDTQTIPEPVKSVTSEKPTAAPKAQNELFELARPPKALERAGSFSADPFIRPPGEERDALNIHNGDSHQDSDKILAAPAVRRLARDHNLNLALVPSSGPNGRVLKGDVLAYIASVPMEERKRQAESLRNREVRQTFGGEPNPVAVAIPSIDSQTPAFATTPSTSYLTEDVVQPVRGIQRIMVKSMTESLKIPHFNFMEEYEMSSMVDFRNELKKTAESRGIKLSYMPILIKAASMSLAQFPTLNAHIKSDASEVVLKASHNIGVAMDTPRGLLVPVIRDCQNRSILNIAQELVRLQTLGAENKLGEQELSGATFTLSNIGAIGGTYASPIIPAPTVVIGAIGKIQTVPKFKNEKDISSGVYAARNMNISWAADHRVVDGATIARFSNQLKSYIENPLSLISDMS